MRPALLLLLLSAGSNPQPHAAPTRAKAQAKVEGMCFLQTIMPASGRLAEMKILARFQDVRDCKTMDLEVGIPFSLSTTPTPCRVKKVAGGRVRLEPQDQELDGEVVSAIKKAYVSKCAPESEEASDEASDKVSEEVSEEE
jgi:hypothetical protein